MRDQMNKRAEPYCHCCKNMGHVSTEYQCSDTMSVGSVVLGDIPRDTAMGNPSHQGQVHVVIEVNTSVIETRK